MAETKEIYKTEIYSVIEGADKSPLPHESFLKSASYYRKKL